MCYNSTFDAADNGLGGAAMSPVRGAGSGGRSFGRALSVNVDVNESSGSDWDGESGTAEDGQALVKECVLLLQRVSSGTQVSQVRASPLVHFCDLQFSRV